MYDKKLVNLISRIITLIVSIIVILMVDSEFSLLFIFLVLFLINRKNSNIIYDILTVIFTISFLLFLVYDNIWLVKIVLLVYEIYYCLENFQWKNIYGEVDYQRLIRFDKKKRLCKITFDNNSIMFVFINLLILIVGIIFDVIL